jgi:hypothetical protein
MKRKSHYIARGFAGKTHKKVLWFLLAIVIIFIALGFMMPAMGRFTPKTDRFLRCSALERWHKDIMSFKQNYQRYPASLHEVCREMILKHLGCPPLFV